MKKLLKKIFLTVFAALIGVLPFSGCAPKTSTDQPVYGDDYTPFRFAAYMTPPRANAMPGSPDYINDTQYSWMKECGFNYAYPIYENSVEDMKRALELAEKHDINYFIRDDEIMLAITGPAMTELPESLKTHIKETVDQYVQYDSFAGINAGDEISKSCFNNARLVKEYWDSLYPNKEFFINLLPMFASPGQLGTRDYQDHLDSFIEIVEPTYLSYDLYALLGWSDDDVKTIRPDHLRNLEIAIATAEKADLPLYTFILTMGHMSYRTPKNYDDLAWQVYATMAFGAKGVQTFTYWTTMDPNDTTITYGLVDMQGNRTETWYSMQKVISEVRSMERAYMQFDYEGTIACPKPSDFAHPQMSILENSLDGHEGIESYAGSEDLLIGCFHDAEERNGYMLVNYADPALDLTNHVEITFKDAKEAIVYSHGKEERILLSGGKFEADIGSGEGFFVIPLK